MNERISQSLEAIDQSYNPFDTAKSYAKVLYGLIRADTIKTESEVQEFVDWIGKNSNSAPDAFEAHFISVCVENQMSRK